MIKVLNLFAGIGGNRKLWKNVEVTAVENNHKIAELYKEFFPNDHIFISDAKEYLLQNYNDFDFIWGSPPCQSHSKMVKFTRHNVKLYPDLSLYEIIIFLQHFYDGKWVIENVEPYYTPLIKPTTKIGRHLFWSNFPIIANEIRFPKDIINANVKTIMKWLDMETENYFPIRNNHDPAQLFRNCVHPKLGKRIFDCAFSQKSIEVYF